MAISLNGDHEGFDFEGDACFDGVALLLDVRVSWLSLFSLSESDNCSSLLTGCSDECGVFSRATGAGGSSSVSSSATGASNGVGGVGVMTASAD